MKSFIKFIIFSLVISIVINIIYIKFINKSDINQLFGFSCLKVLTGSMEPEIKTGENIIIKKCKEYKVGDIITYITNDKELITHRITSIENNLYYTKGDANNTTDTDPISNNQIYGKVILHFNSFLSSKTSSFAKYLDSNKISLNFKIANPIFVVEGDKEILIKDYESTGNYNFTIKNHNENGISDVAFNYIIEIDAEKIVKYKLFHENNEVNTNNSFTLPLSDDKIEQSYLLKLEAPEDYSGTVKINIYAYQKEATTS